MTRLVSILIPAYNAGEWIAETIGSALAQTWPRKEVIVVDDGSADQTLAIARRFAAKDVVVTTQVNQGAATARNNAFALCQGDYIQWLDADDLLSPDKVAKQIDVFERGCSDRTLLSCSWGRFMYRPRHALFKPTTLWCDLSPTEWLIRKMSQNLFMSPATWLVSRALTETAGPWNRLLLSDDDGEYFARVILASEEVRFVPEGRAFYRRSGFESLSNLGRSSEKMEAQLHSIRLHIGYLLSLENSERSRAACVRLLQNWLISFYPDRIDLGKEAVQLAADLGGRLESPRLSWKYDWIRRLFGWGTAKRAQFALNEIKWSVLRWWDRILSRWDR